MSVSHRDRVLALELKLVKALCEEIDTPRALTVFCLIQAEQWLDLLSLSVNPLHYDSHRSFADDYLVTTILQKNGRLNTGIDKEAVAIGKFLEMELLCRETNQRLEDFSFSRSTIEDDVASVINHTRTIAKEILGPLNRKRLDYAEKHMRFGPGATTSLSGVVSLGKKFSKRVLHATPRVADFFIHCLPSHWRGNGVDLELRNSSKLTTVPKNAKTDRCICIEPDVNIYVQLGIGAAIRNQLLHSGLDLNTQENNRRLASVAVQRGLTTLDLSSASDTISREAVWLLLPEDWCNLLEFARVDSTIYDGKVIELEKWSSMGNGYTFELETLIFYSVIKGAFRTLGIEERDFIAYGDDLIFPTELQVLVTKALEFLGFKVNKEKTFGEGLFRESCGADYFDGQNVRPFFLRSEHHDYPTICYLYANLARRYSNRLYGGWGCDGRLKRFWNICFRAVEPAARHLIPEGFGDVGFAVDLDFASRSKGVKQADRGWQGWHFHYRSIAARKSLISSEGCLTAFLSGAISDFSCGRESLRGRFDRASLETGYSFEWPNLGPWLVTEVSI